MHLHGHPNNLTGSTTTTTTHHHNNNNNNHHHHPNQHQLQHNSISLDPSQCLANATTLANLKKQRSLSRSNVLNGSNCENGSVLGAANSTSLNHHHHHGTSPPHNNNNNNSISNNTSMVDGSQVNVQQPALSNGVLQHPGLMDYNGLISDPSSPSSGAVGGGVGGMNKFSGITGDVVSDSTSSKKCCIVM